VLTEEQDAIAAKGFAKPVRTHKVAGLRILLDLAKQDKASAIQAIEDFLSELRG
jgi:hypothetical protein